MEHRGALAIFQNITEIKALKKNSASGPAAVRDPLAGLP